MICKVLKVKLSLFCLIALLGGGQLTKLFAQKNTVTDSLENILHISENDTLKIQVIAQLVREYENNFPDKARLYAQDGMRKAKSISYEKGVGLCLKNLGILDWYESKFKEALIKEQEAQVIFEKIGYKKGLGEVFNTIAAIYHLQGEYANALDYYLKALDIREEIKDKAGAARCLLNIGSLFQEHDDIEKALSYKQKAIVIYKELNDSIGLAAGLADVGVLYTKKKDYQQALDNLQQAKYINEKLQTNKVELSQNLDDIGIVFEKQQKYEQALTYLAKALRLKQDLGYEYGIASTWRITAEVQQKMGLYKQASQNALNALEIFRKIGNKFGVRETCLILTESFKAMKQFDRSLEYYELANAVQDTLFNHEKNRLVDNLEANHQIEMLVKDRTLKEIELEKKSLQLWLLVGGAVMMAIVAMLSLLNFYHVRKMYQIQKQQSEEIALKNQELSALNSQLDEKVKERTALLEFQNSQLRQYAFINSHRLRSPVATILGLLEILSMSQTPEDEKKIMEYLKHSALELDKIVYLIRDTIEHNTTDTLKK